MKTNKKQLLIFSLIAIAILAPLVVRAQFIELIAGNAIATTLAFILTFVVWILGSLFALVIEVFLILIQLNPQDLGGFAAQVDYVWLIVRDLCNMLFIIIMLVVAFGTILRIESYKWNKVLPKIIMVAILINFSKTIALVIIDASQILMMTFVYAFRDIAAGNLLEGLAGFRLLKQGASNAWTGIKSTGGIGAGIAGFQVLLPVVFAILLLVISLLVILVMAILLLVRIIVLWILVAVSPIAYLGHILDATKKYSRMWWDNMIKYAMLGPALAFFLWFAFLFVGHNPIKDKDAVPRNSLAPEVYRESITNDYFGSEASDPISLLNFTVTIILLLVGTDMAIKSGGLGAKAAGAVWKGASGAAKGGVKNWALKGGRLPGMGMASKYIGKPLLKKFPKLELATGKGIRAWGEKTGGPLGKIAKMYGATGGLYGGAMALLGGRGKELLSGRKALLDEEAQNAARIRIGLGTAMDWTTYRGIKGKTYGAGRGYFAQKELEELEKQKEQEQMKLRYGSDAEKIKEGKEITRQQAENKYAENVKGINDDYEEQINQIETDFSNGIITTPEERQLKLSQAKVKQRDALKIAEQTRDTAVQDADSMSDKDAIKESDNARNAQITQLEGEIEIAEKGAASAGDAQRITDKLEKGMKDQEKVLKDLLGVEQKLASDIKNKDEQEALKKQFDASKAELVRIQNQLGLLGGKDLIAAHTKNADQVYNSYYDKSGNFRSASLAKMKLRGSESVINSQISNAESKLTDIKVSRQSYDKLVKQYGSGTAVETAATQKESDIRNEIAKGQKDSTDKATDINNFINGLSTIYGKTTLADIRTEIERLDKMPGHAPKNVQARKDLADIKNLEAQKKVIDNEIISQQANLANFQSGDFAKFVNYQNQDYQKKFFNIHAGTSDAIIKAREGDDRFKDSAGNYDQKKWEEYLKALGFQDKKGNFDEKAYQEFLKNKSKAHEEIEIKHRLMKEGRDNPLSKLQEQDLKKKIKDLDTKITNSRKTIMGAKSEWEMYNRQQRNKNISEEMAKLEGIDTSDELILYFKQALDQGNEFKAAAVIQKLGKNADFNDLLGELKLNTDIHGVNQFFNEFMIKQLGMKDQDAYALQNDVSWEAKQAYQMGMARTTTFENGKYKQNDEKKQLKTIINDVLKKPVEEWASKANRLLYGTERGDGTFEINALGKILLKTAPAELGFLMSEGRMNKNALYKLNEYLQKHPDFFRQLGIADIRDKENVSFQERFNKYAPSAETRDQDAEDVLRSMGNSVVSGLPH